MLQTTERTVNADSLTEPTSSALVGEITTHTTSPADSASSVWHLPVNLEHLEKIKQKVVKKMLYEESAVFPRDANDIGCLLSLPVVLSLKDEIPVKAYASIPKLLLLEVKDCIQDLTLKGWIVKSMSSSPAVYAEERQHITPAYRLSFVKPENFSRQTPPALNS